MLEEFAFTGFLAALALSIFAYFQRVKKDEALRRDAIKVPVRKRRKF